MVVKLLFREIDRRVSVYRKAVFRDIMTTLKAPLLGLKKVTACFNAIIEEEEPKVLRALNLLTRVFSEDRVKVSIILRRVDAYIEEDTVEELKTELEAQNNRLKP